MGEAKMNIQLNDYRTIVAEWYARHEQDRPAPTLATQVQPALAQRSVRVACYASYLRVVGDAA